MCINPTAFLRLLSVYSIYFCYCLLPLYLFFFKPLSSSYGHFCIFYILHSTICPSLCSLPVLLPSIYSFTGFYPIIMPIPLFFVSLPLPPIWLFTSAFPLTLAPISDYSSVPMLCAHLLKSM